MTPAHVDARSRGPARRSSGKLKLQARQPAARADDRDAAVDPGAGWQRRRCARWSRPDSGRVRGAHFGIYDYTALCGITASWQHMRHLGCDFARHMMQVALAQTGVMLVGWRRATSCRSRRTAGAAAHRRPAARERASCTAPGSHFDDVTHSLVNGYYQGWDLHPAQLPTRYAARLRVLLVGAAGSDGAAAQLRRRKRRRPPGRRMSSTMRRPDRRC